MLRLQSFHKVALLPETVDQYLEQDALLSNIPLGVLRRIRLGTYEPESFRGLCIESEAGLEGYAQHTGPYPLVLGRGSDEAMRFLAESLRDEAYPISSLQGPEPKVAAFAAGWPELFERVTQRERQGLYKLEKLIAPRSSGAIFDKANAADLELLIRWFHAFSDETQDIRIPEAELAQQLSQRISCGDLFVLRRGPQVVSMASATRTVGSGRVLSFIYTPPEERGQGYASEITAEASDWILRSGFRFCCLFTQMHNPTSNKIYQNVGYKWVQAFEHVSF